MFLPAYPHSKCWYFVFHDHKNQKPNLTTVVMVTTQYVVVTHVGGDIALRICSNLLFSHKLNREIKDTVELILGSCF